MKEQLVDLNFSFDEISKQIKSLKDAQVLQAEPRNQEDTIIHKYLNENSLPGGEIVKPEVKLSKQSKEVNKHSL
jgi:hypothetical protein